MGLTVSGLCELLVLNRRLKVQSGPRYRPMDPTTLQELRRIGVNINQIAHASNAGLPVDAQLAARNLGRTLECLLASELFAQRAEICRVKEDADDSQDAHARDVFQRSVRLHPARSEDDHA